MPSSQGRFAALAGAGILLTRLLGFVRERLFAHFFGNSIAADAFRAALRIPNIIRNLLGEGTLSASFIPVYSGMIERGELDDARRLSSTIASLLVLLAAVAALVGVLLAPIITDIAAPGFSGERRELTITLVEIMFPMSGLMILSAWCLGVLSSHRRFFLTYAAPALWNIAQITALAALGGLLLERRLIVALAWGALVGSALQVVVQLPSSLRLMGRFGWRTNLQTTGVRRVVRAWIPVVFGAGVYQISSLIDTQLASLLAPGAVAILGYAQLVAILPVSLFGASVAGVALPELSRAGAAGTEWTTRWSDAARRLAYFVLPSAFAFAGLAPLLIGALFQTGAFGPDETTIAAGVLAAYAIGVPAQASVKLLASGHYALGDTKTPVRVAAVSVAVSAGAAFLLMQPFGVAGIALGAALGGYVNGGLNVWRLIRRTGPLLTPADRRAMAGAGLGTLPAAGVSLLVAQGMSAAPIWTGAVATLGSFGLIYGVITTWLGHPEARALVRRLRR